MDIDDHLFFCTKEAIENHHSSLMLHDCMCHILVDMYGMLGLFCLEFTLLIGMCHLSMLDLDARAGRI